MATPIYPLRNIFADNREAKNRLNHTYTKDLDFYVIINSFFFGLKNAGKLNSLTCMNSLNLIKLFPRIILTTYPFLAVVGVVSNVFPKNESQKDKKGNILMLMGRS